jgi:hypothetical protein
MKNIIRLILSFSICFLCDSLLKLSQYNASFDGPPDVFIFGVQKGGTTALAEVITRLQVTTFLKKDVKEPQFFSYSFTQDMFEEYMNGYNKQVY